MTRKGSKKKMQPESLTPPPPANGFPTTSTSTFGSASAAADAPAPTANTSDLLDRARLAGLLDVGASWVDSASNSPLESPLVDRAAWQEERLRAENRELREKLERVERELRRTTAAAAAAAASGSPLDQKKNRRWTMMHVAVAFVAGVVFVFADTTWGENRFVAGGLYTLGTVLLLFAVPALHATGLSRHVGYRMWQPFRGGLRFVVLQAFTWAFYTLAVLAVLGAVMWEDRAAGLLSSGGVLGILSQVLMASSLQTFVAPQDDEPLGLNERVKVSTLHSEGALDQLGDTPFERMQSELMQSFSDEGPLSPLTDDGCGGGGGSGGNVGSAAAAALLGDGAATLPSDLPPVPNKMDSFAELLTLNFLLILIMGALAALSEIFDAALPAALSLLVTAVAVLLTHGLGGKVLRLQGWTFFQPFSGGTQFIVLQGVTWMLFTISILCQMAFLYAALYLGVKLTFGLMHVGGVAALCSEVLCVLSFRYFKGKGRRKERAETTLLIRRCDSSRYLKGHKERELRERRRAVEEEEKAGGVAAAVDAAGRKRRKKKKQGGGGEGGAEEEPAAKKKATKTSVAEENLRISSIDRRESWLSLFTIIFVWNIMYIPFVAHLAFAALPALLPDSVGDVVAPYCYGVFYRGVHWSEAMWTASYPLVGVLLWVTNFSAMQTLGAPRVVSACLSPPWVLLGSLYYVRDSELYPLNLLLTVVWAAYGVTYLGNPANSSKRKDERWVEQTQLWDTICEYFAGRVLLSEQLEGMVRRNQGPADAANQYLLGYHPHGIIPSGMVWGMRCAEWREKLPNLKVTGLTASVMHYVPLMRDLLHWTGIREVSRRTLLSTLDEGHSPVVVVGGQAEMFLSRSRDKAIKIVRHHNGFFKIAQEKQLPIIPIFAFGETKIYDNIELPTMQRWFKDRLGFPIPFFLIGRWNLPIPRRKQLILTVGHPVYPRQGTATDAEVHRLKHEYFDAVQGLFDEFKGPAGYDDHVLEFVDKR